MLLSSLLVSDVGAELGGKECTTPKCHIQEEKGFFLSRMMKNRGVSELHRLLGCLEKGAVFNFSVTWARP